MSSNLYSRVARRFWLLSLQALFILPAGADEVTELVEQHLSTLGFDAGPVDGEATTQTAIAISQFQAEKGLDITGEASPQLAGILAATVKNSAAGPAAAPQGGVPPATSVSGQDDALQAAQIACLEEKIAKKQASKSSLAKRFGNVLETVADSPIQFDQQQLAEVTAAAYDSAATAEDLNAAAKELGLSKNAIKKCQNPVVASPAAQSTVKVGSPPPPTAVVPAAASTSQGASNSALRLSWKDLADAPRGTFVQPGPGSLGQFDGMIACRGSRDPVVRANVMLLVQHGLGSASDNPAVRQRMDLYDQAYENYHDSIAAQCNPGVVSMGYNAHNAYISQVLKQAAASKSGPAGTNQVAHAAPEVARPGGVKLLASADVTADTKDVTRTVLSAFGQIINDDVVTFICSGARQAHKQNALVIYQHVAWGGGRDALDDLVVNYDRNFDREHGRQAELARRLDQNASKYPGSVPFCTDERLQNARKQYDTAVGLLTG